MRTEVLLSNGMILSSYNAIFIPEAETMVISDLHVGYEASMRAEGVAIPDFQFEEILKSLGDAMDHFSPSQIIINGDIKHEFARNLGQEWDEVFQLIDFINDKDSSVKFVRGNHDNFLKTIISKRDVEMADSYRIGDLQISHGHLSSKSLVTHDEDVFNIYGHEHPVLRLRDEIGARIIMPCFLYGKSNKFVVMPAFSPLASGTNVISPNRNFMIEELRELDVSKARIYATGEGEIMDFGMVGDHLDEDDGIIGH